MPLYDWAMAIALALSVLYIPYIFEDLAFRVGNPLPVDVLMGSILLVGLLEATRRAMGWPLPIIALVFMAMPCSAILPRPAQARGQYLAADRQPHVPDQPGRVRRGGGRGGDLRVPLLRVAGVLATRIGLGQLFLTWLDHRRYAGGPAKVSVFGSAMFGMLSGSSVANAVTVGSLTIPAMIRIGYPRHFAAGVEAASSTGGQITPPIAALPRS